MFKASLKHKFLKMFGMRPYIMRLPVYIEPDGDGYFAWVPGWDDVYAPGETRDEALTNIAYTAIVVFRSYRRRGMSIPYPYGFIKDKPKKNIRFYEINVPIYT